MASGTITGTTANSLISSRIVWSSTTNTSANTSSVTATLQYKKSSSSDSATWGTDFSGSITINGSTKTIDNLEVLIKNNNTWVTVASYTVVVSHNTNGSKSITISATGKISGTTLKSTTCSGTVTLDTIPRASSITSASAVILGNKCSVKWTPLASSFAYKLKFTCGSVSYTTGYISPGTISAYTYSSYTMTVATWAAAMPNTNTATCTVTLYTYTSSSSSSSIGSDSATFSLTLSNNAQPTVSFTTPVLVDGWNGYYIQGKSKCTLSATFKAGEGSTIKSCSISGTGLSKSGTGTSLSGTTSVLTKSGTLTYTAKVTDGRATVSATKSIYVYPYAEPVVKLTIPSTTTNGSIQLTYNASCSSINGKNSLTTLKIYYKLSTSSVWPSSAAKTVTLSSTSASGNVTLSGLNSASSYDFKAVVTDTYGSSSDMTADTASEFRILNIKANKQGIAIGKMAEVDNLFESNLPVRCLEGLTLGTSTQNSAPTSGIAVHDVRNAELTPDSFGNKNVNFYFDTISGSWYGIMHMKGWTGNYAAWELAGNANEVLNDDTLKYRQGIGSTWGDWQTVITDKNIDNYMTQGTFLPISGGTLTDKLNLSSNRYFKADDYGLNCQNSDIINVNGIYFQDATDTASEGIHFYRSEDYVYDTLYALDGKLKFHPNRGVRADLGGYTIYNSSNFRRGTCTLSSSNYVDVSFSSALGGVPTVMLTPLTDSQGVIPGKVTEVSSTGFTAIIGGSAVSSAKFAYLAIYY